MIKTSVYLIDVQRDFCKGGALAVPDGDAVVSVCNKLIKAANSYGCPIILSRDWHPADHCSFVPNGGIWPVHCVAGTPGAEFHRGLQLPIDAMVFSKGVDRDIEAYSAFDVTNVLALLHEANIERLVMCGLATDYCVKQSVLDACKSGFEVMVIKEGCRAVNVNPDDGSKAFAEMQAAGAILCSLKKAVFI